MQGVRNMYLLNKEYLLTVSAHKAWLHALITHYDTVYMLIQIVCHKTRRH